MIFPILARWNTPAVKRAALAAGLALSLGGLLLFGGGPPRATRAQSDHATLTGAVFDTQDNPVCEAEVALYGADGSAPLAQTQSHCEDGTFVLSVSPTQPLDALKVQITQPHFQPLDYTLSAGDVARINAGEAVQLPGFTLDRRIDAAFWIATITFVGILLLIAFEVLHNTLAALLGVAIVFVVSAIGHFVPGLFVFDFARALSYVNFEVIFLVMGMMIVIAAVEETGVFQWVTYQAYRLSGGRVWLLVVILMMTTAIASALLDNVTTMLLMAPLTIQIGIALGVDPLSLLLPEVLASNIGGITTLIGTPTNILIGSYAGLSFNDFLFNLTPGVLVAQAALIAFVIARYRKGWVSATGGGLSPALLERLAEAGRIKEPVKLGKAGSVFGAMLVGFVLGESIHMAPAVVAIVGAVAMLLWVAPDIETMMQLVDWTTLMFFIALFIVVGAIQEVGLLSIIAAAMQKAVGENLILTMLVLTWASAILSGAIANIPFTAAMLPVVGLLSRTVPGATSHVLFYCLSIGAAMGGNSSLIGASANMVTAGIAERAGYRITYMRFLKVGLPATAISVAVASVWLLLHFHVF